MVKGFLYLVFVQTPGPQLLKPLQWVAVAVRYLLSTINPCDTTLGEVGQRFLSRVFYSLQTLGSVLELAMIQQ